MKRSDDRRAYGPDLAFIHDAGFTEFSRRAAPGLLTILRRNGVPRGRVVELGCGSGALVHALARAGYEAIGIDQSPSMIALARQRVPRSQGKTQRARQKTQRPQQRTQRPQQRTQRVRFHIASFTTTALPRCDAIVAVGECFNYALSARDLPLRRLFARAGRALSPGGLLVFDALLPGPRPVVTRAWSEGKGWAVLVETRASSRALIRRIVSHRWMASRFRRSEEVHRLRLYPAARLEAWLERAGFRVSIARGYGRFRLPAGNRMVFIARRQ